MSKSSRSRANDQGPSSPTSPSTSSEVQDEAVDAKDDAAASAKTTASKAKGGAKAKTAGVTGAGKDVAAKSKGMAAKGKDATTAKAKTKAAAAKEAADDATAEAKSGAKGASKAKGTTKTPSAQKTPAKATNSKTRSSNASGPGKSRSQRGRGSKKASAQVSRREQLRRQREAAERARKRRMRIVTGIGALVLAGVLFVVGFVLYRDWDNKRKEEAALRSVQVIPPNANPEHTGLAAGVKASDPNAPTLIIYQDYQCPACKSAEDRYGDVIRALAAGDKVNVEFRTLTFLDVSLKNDSSVRSARAAACAATVGKYDEYHDTIYKNQPETEGVGYTDEQLLTTFPAEAGITSNLLTTFQDCYKRNRTFQIVKDINTHASDVDKVSSTPTYKVNGKNPKWDYTDPQSGASQEVSWWQTLDATEDAWIAAINKVASEDDNNTPTPSP